MQSDTFICRYCGKRCWWVLLHNCKEYKMTDIYTPRFTNGGDEPLGDAEAVRLGNERTAPQDIGQPSPTKSLGSTSSEGLQASNSAPRYTRNELVEIIKDSLIEYIPSCPIPFIYREKTDPTGVKWATGEAGTFANAALSALESIGAVKVRK